MSPRPAAGLLVSALIRGVEADGGSAMVLARGDASAGAILIQLAHRGTVAGLLERTLGVEGYDWKPTGPDDAAERDGYIARRRRADPDLWVVELDSRNAEAILRAVAG